ncbi:MAG: hypothetical protein LC624_05330, partial [Halobacteriales archaeon]|nr:hypothetical protein [Halobacteriales archaeon]
MAALVMVAPVALALPLPAVPVVHAVPVLDPRLLTDVQGAYSLGLTSHGEPIVSNGLSVWKYNTDASIAWEKDIGSGSVQVTVDAMDRIIVGAATTTQ